MERAWCCFPRSSHTGSFSLPRSQMAANNISPRRAFDVAGLGWQWNSRLLNLTSNRLAAYRHLMRLRSSLSGRPTRPTSPHSTTARLKISFRMRLDKPHAQLHDGCDTELGSQLSHTASTPPRVHLGQFAGLRATCFCVDSPLLLGIVASLVEFWISSLRHLLAAMRRNHEPMP